MLLGDFFTITEFQQEGNEVKAMLEIDASHKIFEGHFPGQPVVPGVCMMQMVKEILEKLLGRKTDLVKAHEMKFMVVINPEANNKVLASLKYSTDDTGEINLTAGISKDETVHFKFKGQFRFQ